MPCWNISRTTIQLSTAVKHPSLMADAIKALGGVVTMSGKDGTTFAAVLDGVAFSVTDGQLTTRADETAAAELVGKFTQAYGMAAAKKSAQDEGWDFTPTGAGTFTVTKTTGF